jgi:hypothetical protein
MSRRSFLKLAVVSQALKLVTSHGASTPEKTAVTPGKRLRQWGAVINLRRCDGCQSLGTAPQCA